MDFAWFQVDLASPQVSPPSIHEIRQILPPKSSISGDDAEHPMDITMSRVRLASDTCDIYFTYTKVNHLLYTCSIDTFDDGILLDTPLMCMHRYCQNTTDDEEECKRQGTTTPSAREAWKQRRKKTETTPRTRTSGPGPDIRPLKMSTTAAALQPKCYRPRTSGVSPGHPAPRQQRTSGLTPGNPDKPFQRAP